MLFQTPVVSPTASPKPSETPRPKTVASAELLDEEPSSHETLDARRYSAVELHSYDRIYADPEERTGETEAKLFFMAYTLDNPPAKRPLMFSFNGGPGSARSGFTSAHSVRNASKCSTTV